MDKDWLINITYIGHSHVHELGQSLLGKEISSPEVAREFFYHSYRGRTSEYTSVSERSIIVNAKEILEEGLQIFLIWLALSFSHCAPDFDGCLGNSAG